MIAHSKTGLVGTSSIMGLALMATLSACSSDAPKEGGGSQVVEKTGQVSQDLSLSQLTNSSFQVDIALDGPPVGTSCAGPDGIVMLHVSGHGTIVSSDPLFNGKVFYANANILDNAWDPVSTDPNKGYGVSRDDFEIRDPANGNALVAKGTAEATDRVPFTIQATSKLHVALAYGGGWYTSGTTVTLPAPGAPPVIHIEYGMPRPTDDTNNRGIRLLPSVGATCLQPFVKIPNWYGVNF